MVFFVSRIFVSQVTSHKLKLIKYQFLFSFVWLRHWYVHLCSIWAKKKLLKLINVHLLNLSLMLNCCVLWDICAGADPDFPDRGDVSPRGGGTNLLFFAIFPKKMAWRLKSWIQRLGEGEGGEGHRQHSFTGLISPKSNTNVHINFLTK